MINRNFQLGYFLKEKHVSKSFELVKKQLEETCPLYNNIDFSLYKQIDISSINPQELYKLFLEKDSFYYFEDLFYSKKYYSIQKAYNTREFHHLSLHLLILYYAIGFYFRDLLNKDIEIFKEIISKKNFKVFYGGNINLVSPKKSAILYYQDYKEFLLLKEKSSTPKPGYTIYAISLDIKSFFYSINHDILLDIIEKKCSPTLKKEFNYDEYSKESISFLLKFVLQDTKGLPVSNQNLISGFLSSIYLSVFDEYILDHYLIQEKYHYIRYVDDFYLFFEEYSDSPIQETRKSIYDIENEFSSFLLNSLGLNVSTSKCERYEIKDLQSQKEFLISSFLNSPFEGEFDYENLLEDTSLRLSINEKRPKEIFTNCLNILKNIKDQTKKAPKIILEQVDSVYLNYLLIHKPCLNFSKKKESIEEIIASGIFKDNENLDFFLIKPKVMFHLLTLSEEIRKSFFKMIIESLNNGKSLLPKLTILDRFLHQIIFLRSEANDKKELENEYQEYLKTTSNVLPKIIPKNPDTYLSLLNKFVNLSTKEIDFERIYEIPFLKSETASSLTQQIKLKQVSERLNNFNLSFNHLLNEFQNMFEISYFNSINKTCKDIIQIMKDEGYSTSEIRLINNFFERRNNNSISHTNSLSIGLWRVDKEEYFKYKEETKKVLKKVANHYIKSQVYENRS